MAALVALVSAALYGAGDFLGGLASRRLPTTFVVTASQAAGLVVLLGVIGLLPEAHPTTADLWWGVAAGLGGSVGVGLLYRALALGTMGVVAPTTAVCAVLVPVAVSAWRGNSPGPLAAVGIVLALLGIVLVSQEAQREPATTPLRPGLPPGIAHALASGVAIGGFYLAIAEASPSSGLWPLVGARAAAIPLFGSAAMAGARVPLTRPGLTLSAAAGVVDMSANVLYLLASRMGSLPVVVTLASLYPASTVLLARVVLGEQLGRTQAFGIAMALVAVVCIVLAGAR
jgi:drug/metabolite transporter (DMT)-like permease